MCVLRTSKAKITKAAKDDKKQKYKNKNVKHKAYEMYGLYVEADDTSILLGFCNCLEAHVGSFLVR